MKGVIILLVIAGAFYYAYQHTTLLDKYLGEYAPSVLEAKNSTLPSDKESGYSSLENTQGTSAGSSFMELRSSDGRAMQAIIISRGPVGIRAKRLDGQTFEIPFDKLDSQTVANLQAIQSFPHP
ncbi:hypothetical protein FEM03_05190 [Phragmitibacter flavus]|uniref:Uncharacterized protein n=1 Tax=Phragmitibacter flavus TaxID=2576071 RepID=A0A5R8KIN9_9BACT|nr:hypothetical protein [Phragmitibacter flavus]TLD72120.1 hypothetical protein FEM03_05190 [Phragmitibacter flavus]